MRLRVRVMRLRVRIMQAILLNYRKDGSPFWNLLEVRPLHRCARPSKRQLPVAQRRTAVHAAATRRRTRSRRAVTAVSAGVHAAATHRRTRYRLGCSGGAFRGFSARIVDLSREIEYVDRCGRIARESNRAARDTRWRARALRAARPPGRCLCPGALHEPPPLRATKGVAVFRLTTEWVCLFVRQVHADLPLVGHGGAPYSGYGYAVYRLSVPLFWLSTPLFRL